MYKNRIRRGCFWKIKMNTVKIALLLFAPCVFSVKSSEIEVIIPGGAIEGSESIETYQAPYQKFGEIGFFAEDRRLKYSIAEDLLDKTQYTNFMDLILLSENHWIALNKRNLELATKISYKMNDIIWGKYGLNVANVNQAQKKKLTELKFRCLEQIEMSASQLNPINPNFNISTSELYQRNFEECKCMYWLAKKLTNTPVFFQDASYDFGKIYGIAENPHVMIPILDRIHAVSEKVLDDCLEENPGQELLIKESYEIKKEGYSDYLKHIYQKLQTIKMSDYRAIDRGQNSGGHRNTCLFNSVFYLDFSKHNIASTKIGSIEKGKNYLSNINNLYSPYLNSLNGNPLFESSQICKTLNNLSKNSSVDAHYSFVSNIQDGKIFPGVLSNCSALEIQCHALMSNFMIFPKVRTHNNGNCLFSNYGTGYYGSENFSIFPVSCSTGHAQGLRLL